MARFRRPTYVNHFINANIAEAAPARGTFIWTFEDNVFHVPTAYNPAPPLP